MSVDTSVYSIDQAWAKKYVTLRLDAVSRSFVVEYREQPIKQVPIKGLVGELLPLSTYLEHITREARTQTIAGRPIEQQLHLPLEMSCVRPQSVGRVVYNTSGSSVSISCV